MAAGWGLQSAQKLPAHQKTTPRRVSGEGSFFDASAVAAACLPLPMSIPFAIICTTFPAWGCWPRVDEFLAFQPWWLDHCPSVYCRSARTRKSSYNGPASKKTWTNSVYRNGHEPRGAIGSRPRNQMLPQPHAGFQPFFLRQGKVAKGNSGNSLSSFSS